MSALLYTQYVAAKSDRHVGTLTVVEGRIEHALEDLPMDEDTLVFVDRNTNEVIYAGTSSLNVNHLGRMSNHTVRDTSHDWLSWYIRLACTHVDVYMVFDGRYADLTARSANKKAQIRAAVNKLEGKVDTNSLRNKLNETDQEIGDLLKRLTALHAERSAIVGSLFLSKKA
ncbi:hypothetical protein BH10PSE8_BH10PSE8_09610 [soil metagenome]